MNLPPFEQVVTDHGPTVLRVCRAVLGPDDAEDAWSETFLSAMQAYPRLRPDSDVVAWLVTIAHRKAIDQVRAAQRRAITVPELPDRPAPDDDRLERRRPASGTHSARCPSSSARPSPITTSWGCPIARSPAIVGGSEDAARRAAADGIASLRTTIDTGAPR